MATQGRRTDTSLEKLLWQEPWRFDFFQAVRLLELIAQRERSQGKKAPSASVGYDAAPAREVVRFKAFPARSFAASEIVKLSAGSNAEAPLPQMQVAFMGLTGAAGVLPESYLDLMQQRMRDRDYALRDFFDLFNHRTISLFYRAWEKYRCTVGYERARRNAKLDDAFTRTLECLIGRGTKHQSERLAVPDDRLLAYAGHFAHFPRSAVVLQTLLADHFKVPVKLEQFVGRWLALEADQCTRLPSAGMPKGQFNQLGVDAVIGAQVWDVQSRFRIRLGPMTDQTFRRFLPHDGGGESRALLALVAFTRAYVGLEKDFDIQLALSANRVPVLRLGAADDFEPRLGWNTWLGSKVHRNDRDDTHFSPEQLLEAP